MLRLFQLIFLGHWHKWKTIHTAELYVAWDDKAPYGFHYTQQCEHCGIVKGRRV